ncbi:MAG: DUF3823 domain-containing protein [Bacteroidales bacterium]|nr:DUF3823 domain-containing protein [Bacteroidales bacterium]
MKKLASIITLVLSMGFFASCELLQLDNFDGPNAQVTGKFLDAKTGEKMGIESSVSSVWDWSTWSMKTTTIGSMVVIEQGWTGKDGQQVSEDQNWMVRFDGQYTNNLVFAADYKLDTKNLPCYQPENVDFTLKKGSNTVDFTVTPFCRIVVDDIHYDAATKKILATFKVELGDATKANSINTVALCANTQMFVGYNYFNLAKDDIGAKREGAFDWTTWSQKPAAQPGEAVTLSIDTGATANAELFKYEQDRYIRVAALAAGNGYNGNNYYNFSKIYRISADFSKVEEVVWE